MKIFYCVNDIDPTYRFSYESSSNYDLGTEYECEALLEECADNYWRDHDGWESSWPHTFILYKDQDGPEIGRFTVEMEAEPRFYATSIEKI